MKLWIVFDIECLPFPTWDFRRLRVDFFGDCVKDVITPCTWFFITPEPWIKTCVLFWQRAFTWCIRTANYHSALSIRETLSTRRKRQTCWSLRSRPVSPVQQTQSCRQVLRRFIVYDDRRAQFGDMPETSSRSEMHEKRDFNEYITMYSAPFKGKNPSCV